VTAPEVLPVYLAVPSSGTAPLGAADPVIASFADGLALHPTMTERVLLGVVEYSQFANELCPLGTTLESAAHLAVSGFDGISFGALFNGMAQLLEYDRYRLSGHGVRLGRPVLAVIVNSTPSVGDCWHDDHRSLIDLSDAVGRGAPVVVAVSTAAAAVEDAAAMASSADLHATATDSARAGEVAASLTVRACGCGESVSGVRADQLTGSYRTQRKG
jgi:uncharacterized protein YegL